MMHEDAKSGLNIENHDAEYCYVSFLYFGIYCENSIEILFCSSFASEVTTCL